MTEKKHWKIQRDSIYKDFFFKLNFFKLLPLPRSPYKSVLPKADLIIYLFISII